MTQQLKIGHLYPDQMNIYGDRGNIVTLIQRCLWRGIDAMLQPIGVGAEVDWGALDIVFFGGGQDSGQALVAHDLVTRHGAALKQAIDGGLVLLAICGGYQLLGHYFLTHTGEKLPGIGALDVHTVGSTKRMIGNVVVEATGLRAQGSGVKGQNPKPWSPLTPEPRTPNPEPWKLVGFENHSGQTFLGANARPLGTVLVGNGNNGEDGTEGAVYQNTIGSYMHGSLLPKNPQLADELIRRAMQRRYGSDTLTALDDTLELRAQRVMIERVTGG